MAYLAASWLVLQVLDFLANPFSWPDPVLRIATILLAVGVLPVLVIAWYHGEKGAQRVSVVELLMLTATLIVGVAAVMWAGGGQQQAGSRVPASVADSLVDSNSIAVLPFVNVSGDVSQEYFSDGLTEELHNALAQIPQLHIASRTSSFSFKNQTVPVDSIGRALRVAHLLEGSVRKSENRVRISARLTQVQSGYQLWSQSYDRDLADVFALQTEIATDIARILNIELVQRRAESAAAASIDPEAYDAYLRGLYRMNALDYGSARTQLELAVESAPEFGPAWAVLSDAYNQLGRRTDARSAARRAVEADSSLAAAYAALAYIDFFYDRDWPAAEQNLERALALDPTHIPAIQRRAYAYVAMGRGDDAVREIDRAAVLDPLSPRVAVDQGLIYILARRYQLAEGHLHRLLADDSSNTWARSFLGHVALAQGRTDEAVSWFAHANDSLYLSVVAGDTVRALSLLEARRRRGGRDRAYELGRGYALLGKADDAFRWLEQGLADQERLIMLAAVDPHFDSLRSDPRMRGFLNDLGAPWSEWPSSHPPET